MRERNFTDRNHFHRLAAQRVEDEVIARHQHPFEGAAIKQEAPLVLTDMNPIQRKHRNPRSSHGVIETKAEKPSRARTPEGFRMKADGKAFLGFVLLTAAGGVPARLRFPLESLDVHVVLK